MRRPNATRSAERAGRTRWPSMGRSCEVPYNIRYGKYPPWDCSDLSKRGTNRHDDILMHATTLARVMCLSRVATTCSTVESTFLDAIKYPAGSSRAVGTRLGARVSGARRGGRARGEARARGAARAR